MIGRLRGVLAEVEPDHCVIDCAGVGYVVACGARTLQRLPAPGDEAVLHIETNWSQENGPRLYGFLTRDDRRAFTTLTGIQGVGPKAALSVLDILPPGELAQGELASRELAHGVAQPAGPEPSYSAEYSCEKCSSTRARRTLRLGVSSPPSTDRSRGRISNRLMVSHRFRPALSVSM